MIIAGIVLGLIVHPGWLVVLLPVGFLLLLFVVALLEHRHTYPFMEVPPGALGGGRPELPPYARRMSDDAANAGLEFGGFIVHVKYPRIKILGTTWMSPARDFAVIIGSGTVMNMPSRQTWLVTPVADGRYLLTSDQNDEGDPSGLYLVRRKINVPFEKLLAFHRRRIEQRPGDVRAFPEPTALDAVLNMYGRRAVEMVSSGRAKWLTPDQQLWRYTVTGAMHVVLNFPVQLVAALGQFWRVNAAGMGAATSPRHNDQFVQIFAQSAPGLHDAQEVNDATDQSHNA